MNIVYVSLVTSSNDLKRCKMIHLSIRRHFDGTITEFQSLIKPVPALSTTERGVLPFDYTLLRKSQPLCDVAPTILDWVQNSETVFIDRFSERVFRKALREIGYPMGSATYILEKMFNSITRSILPFDLKSALESFKIDYPISNNKERSKGMELVFNRLMEMETPHQSITERFTPPASNTDDIDLGHLPQLPGVYLFRDCNGTIIYVGKAINIAKRVRSHFTSRLAFEKELCQATKSIEFEETGSETIALLLESYYIRDLKPIFNTQQKEVIDPYIITSKEDSKGILRIQAIQKSYKDSENEFYYNRDSAMDHIRVMQRKYKLCRRFTGIERTAGKCSDMVFCKGICRHLEMKEDYNRRVKEALQYIEGQRPSFILKLKGRNLFETGFVLVKRGIYHGYGFVDAESQINSIHDIESFSNNHPHTYFTSRIIDQYFKSHKRSAENIIHF